MKRQRVRLIVEVDLDPIPGACHTPESWLAILTQRMGEDWYHPTVTLARSDAEAAAVPVLLNELADRIAANCGTASQAIRLVRAAAAEIAASGLQPEAGTQATG